MMLVQRFFFFLAISSISLSLFPPETYSLGYNICSMLLYILEVYCYFKIKNKNSYFDFDVIFLLVFGISAFAYPVFFYMPNAPFIYFFNLPFDVNYISKAVSLSLLASTSYMIGGLYKPLGPYSNVICSSAKINNNGLILIIAVFILLFFLLGGISQLQSTYKKNVEAEATRGVLQIMAILQAVFLVAISTEFYNKRIIPGIRLNKVLLLEIFIFSAIMFYAGNRTYALILLLPLFFYYTISYYKIRFYQLLLLLPLAFCLMWLIQVTRTGENVEQQTLKMASLFGDIVIPSRSNYIVYEVVDKYGFTYGESMSGGLIGTVPSLESFLKSFCDLDNTKIGSASYFTLYTFGDIGKGIVGLGTMLQADAYLSFGILGVMLIFFLIGYTVNRAYWGICNARYYSYILYSALMAHSVFWIRAEATYPVKIIVWGFIIAYLNKYISGKEWQKK